MKRVAANRIPTANRIAPGWTVCDGDCEHRHGGPFGWVTTEGWQLIDEDAVARGLSYDHGVSVYAESHDAWSTT